MKAKVINPLCTLYGEIVDVQEKVIHKIVYIDDDSEEYSEEDLKFL